MKHLYVVWGVIVIFIMLSANSAGTRIFDIFSGGGSGYSSGSGGGYGRGWGWGSGGGGGGGYHK